MLGRILAVTTLCIGLVACGFQLRGTGQSKLAGQLVFISSEIPMGALEKNLKRDLQVAGAQLTESSTEAALQVSLGELQFETQGVSRDATGRANEVILRAKMAVTFQKSVAQTSPDTWVDNRQLKASRSYYQDYRNPISEQNLQKEAREQIVNELSSRLVRQIEWALEQ
jgi:LPS-assembly lipoprotein